MKKKILLALLILVVAIQFIRVDKTNPETDPDLDFISILNPPEEVKKTLKNACYDCHSHHTKYPWYFNIAPVSWWLADHVEHARGNLNFSEWGTYTIRKAAHKLEECAEEVEEKEMPLKGYRIMHAEADLSDDERTVLVKWFKSAKQELESDD